MLELEQPQFICHVETTVVTSLAEAERLKKLGNECFKNGSYVEAEKMYRQALGVAPKKASARAVYCGNIAACLMRRREYEAAVEMCTRALRINPMYAKVLVRRSTAYEQMEDFDRALVDAKQALKVDPDREAVRNLVKRLEGKLRGCQNAAMREMMFGKLKDLGNTVLGPFGVSVDDFKAERDPSTGSYSISFKT